MEAECTDTALAACGISEKVHFRPYQMEGIRWLIGCRNNGHGGILADEMGLGKTCQTIAFLVAATKKACGVKAGTAGAGRNARHLVVCPLSVIDGWQVEFKRFAPGIAVLIYIGDKDERLLLQQSANEADVVLTTYELCLNDNSFFKGLGAWEVVVVDEGHRLKNSESLLHKALLQCPARCRVLLTGTPIQNNLAEMYNLLSFVSPDTFDVVQKDKFLTTYATAATDPEVAADLQRLVRPYMLRRTKTVVASDIPSKAEVMVYHGISELQKKYYKAILMHDRDAFQEANRTRLLNVLMQLRKCVDHPYLFDGVEPEPFEAGEHLVTASGKLIVLDALLRRLHAGGHRVLVFSQMTRMLDILQDYVTYRGYKYERLDGSVRGEERFVAVRNFREQCDTFIFLLSSRAGGQGLNLTGADTVIFYDSDFNPQVDLQAEARAHRIGQTRPVKVFRLLARNTVEEVIVHRARTKLKLTKAVIEADGGDGTSSAVSVALTTAGAQQLRDALKLGLDKLFASKDSSSGEASSDVDQTCGLDVDAVLGESVNGRWVQGAAEGANPTEGGDATATTCVTSSDIGSAAPATIYEFEGKDYSHAVAAADRVFDELASEQLRAVHLHGRLRSDQPGTGVAIITGSSNAEGHGRRRRQLTAEELEERRKKRAEAAARRAAQEAAEEQRKAERRLQRLQALWKDNSYVSCKIESSSGEDEGSSEEGDASGGSEVALGAAAPADVTEDEHAINYVSGDVTKPFVDVAQHAVIVHCVDDSGVWGRGGVFDAVASLSPLPAARYELSAKMKDLSLGDVHLVDLQDDGSAASSTPDLVHKYVALVVAQHRDRGGRLSGVRLEALEAALRRIRHAAVRMSGRTSVHLPRIGYNTPNFNWYGTERLIRKVLVTEGGLDTYIYYYPRRLRGTDKRRRQSSEDDSEVAGDSSVGPSDAKARMRRRSSNAGSIDSCGEVKDVAGDSPTASLRGHVPTGSWSSGGDGASTSGGGFALLPPGGSSDGSRALATVSDALSDVSVAFDASVSGTERERLRSLVLAYGGEVHEGGTRASTTYVIADESMDEDGVLARCRSLTTPALSTRWLDECARAGEQLDISSYLLT